jgi:hypothetical protein
MPDTVTVLAVLTTMVAYALYVEDSKPVDARPTPRTDTSDVPVPLPLKGNGRVKFETATVALPVTKTLVN